jgi:cell division protein FtsW (lipid II flippase)
MRYVVDGSPLGRTWPQRWGARLLGLLFLSAVGGALGAAWLLFDELLAGVAKVQTLSRTIVALPPGQDVVIGRADLMQPVGESSPADRHFRLTRPTSYGRPWTIANVAADRRLQLRYERHERAFADSWDIAADDVFVLDVGRFRVLEATWPRLFFEWTPTRGTPLRFTLIADLAQPGQLEPAQTAPRWLLHCSDTGAPSVFQQLRQWTRFHIQRWLPASVATALGVVRAARTVLRIGGEFSCPGDGDVPRLHIAGLRADTLRVVEQTFADGTGVFKLQPGAHRPQIRFRGADRQAAGFTGISWPLVHPRYGRLTSIIAGRTRYLLKQPSSGQLHLVPQDSLPLLPIDGAQAGSATGPTSTATCDVSRDMGPGVRVTPHCALPYRPGEGHWQVNLIPQLPRSLDYAVAFVPLGLALAAFLATRLPWYRRLVPRELDRGRRRLRNVTMWSLLIVAGWFAVVCHQLLQGLGDTAPLVGGMLDARVPFLLMLANWAIAALLLAGRTGGTPLAFALFVATLLLALHGALAQAALGFGASSTRWLGYFEKQTSALAIVPALAALAICARPAVVRAAMGEFYFGDRRILGIPVSGLFVRFLPVILFAVLMIAWVAIGRETGLGSFQPIEFGKVMALAYIVVIAGVLAHWSRYKELGFRRSAWLLSGVYAIAIAVFFALFVVFPFLQSDYSPIIIIVLAVVVIVLRFLITAALRQLVVPFRDARAAVAQPVRWIARRRYKSEAIWAVGTVAMLITFSVVTFAPHSLRWVLPDWSAALLAPLVTTSNETEKDTPEHVRLRNALDALRGDGPWRKPAERVLSWLDLTTAALRPGNGETLPVTRMDYPDIGLQVLRSREAIAAASADTLEAALARAYLRWWCRWSQTDTRCPTLITSAAILGRSSTVAMAIPAVQDDFMAAFTINRFGHGAGRALLMLHAATLFVLLAIGLRLARSGTGTLLDRTTRDTLSAMTIGGAIILALHWSISWGNVFGHLPVMGQPMTWLSAGRSHMLFMAVPIFCLALIAERYAAADKAFAWRDHPPPR